jgi:hypothetical protein
MNVYLIRSEEISCSRFATIVDIVRRTIGPIKFIATDEDISVDGPDPKNKKKKNIDESKFTPQCLKWETLFRNCEVFREENKAIDKNDYVVFFTDNKNERNWFSSMDPSGAFNFFISTSGWADLLEAEEFYPVIYELATIPLMIETCGSLQEVENMTHKDYPNGNGPRGCPWDYCSNKKFVELRYRTGDICPDCRKKITENKVDPSLVRQVLAIMDDIRGQMLYKRIFPFIQQISKMEVNKRQGKLSFTDINNLSVHLGAREMAFYIFFLKHPEGVEFRYLNPKGVEEGNKMNKVYVNELRIIYESICGDAILARLDSAMKNFFKERSNILKNIKDELTVALGRDIASHYIIDRKPKSIKDGKKSLEHIHYIKLDRKNVIYTRDAN